MKFPQLNGFSSEKMAKIAPFVPEIILLCAFYVAGFLLPWWGILIPAIIAGGIEVGSEKRLTRTKIALVGMVSWLSAAFAQDIFTLGRLSSRIAAVMSLKSSLAAYVVTGLFPFFVALLGAEIGYLVRRGSEEQKARMTSPR